MDLNKEPIQIKLVVIGDGSVGKTCILLSYTTDKFPTDYVPTIFDNYITSVELDGKQINLSLWDTAGQETYDKIRTLSYSQADIFLIVFSVVDKTSYENAKNKWYPELNQGELYNIPKIIVGNKIDCRSETNKEHIKYEEASKDLKSQNLKYIECSALTQEGLKEVFEEAVKQGYENKLKQLQQNKKQDQPLEQHQQENCCCKAF